MSEPSILDARLADIDRRLRMIQSGLEPAVGGAPAAPPQMTAPSPDPEPSPAVPEASERGADPSAAAAENWSQSVGPPGPTLPSSGDVPAVPEPPASGEATPSLEEAGRLISRLRDLVADQERLLTSSRELQSALAETLTAGPPPAAQAAGPAAPAASVTVSAGPFAGTDALRSFERALWSLPGVRDVILREYEGTDRAVVEVRLAWERLGTDAPPTS
jgi:hypothetical protein